MGLLISYRALGGGRTLSIEESAAALAHLVDLVDEQARGLTDALASRCDSGDGFTTLGHQIRRRLADQQQSLAQLDLRLADDPIVACATELDLALQSLGWSARLIEAPGCLDNSGMMAAAAELRRHGAEAVSAARLLRDQSASEQTI